MKRRILFITDTWDMNANGVVTWLANTVKQLEARDFAVKVIHPGQFRKIGLPTYPDVKLALTTRGAMAALIRQNDPDYIHIVTEGSLGLMARLACLRNHWQFTSFYHTRLPEYAALRLKILGPPTSWYVRWFHNAGAATLVSTETLKAELEHKGFKNVRISPMGVDMELFRRNPAAQAPTGLLHPIFVYMGRLAPEKNIETFLRLDLPGSRMIIGDGPSSVELKRKFSSHALFTGNKAGTELVDLLSASDVYVFPSKTDTFSLTIIEALACGLPVAAYDVQGPKNILTDGYDGFIGDDLRSNAIRCLDLSRENCARTAERYSWQHATDRFIETLVPIK